MPATLIQLLTICVLAVVYLFFLRVLRAVWVGVRPPRPRPRPVRSRDESGGKNQKAPAVLNVIEPPEQRGQSYALDDELTVGRAAGCRITVDDSYASQLHARVYIDEGVVSLEDLGSTNGTYINREKVIGPRALYRGDRVQIGSTVFEVG